MIQQIDTTTKSKVTTFKTNRHFREAFAARACLEGMSLSDFIRAALEKRLQEPLPPRPFFFIEK